MKQLWEDVCTEQERSKTSAVKSIRESPDWQQIHFYNVRKSCCFSVFGFRAVLTVWPGRWVACFLISILVFHTHLRGGEEQPKWLVDMFIYLLAPSKKKTNLIWKPDMFKPPPLLPSFLCFLLQIQQSQQPGRFFIPPALHLYFHLSSNPINMAA